MIEYYIPSLESITIIFQKLIKEKWIDQMQMRMHIYEGLLKGNKSIFTMLWKVQSANI